MIKRLGACITALWLTSLGAHAGAQEHCGPDNERCVATGTWEVQLAVGAGLRTNPLADSDPIPLVVIPQVSYYGKRFFLDNLDLGYTLVDKPRWMLNALITPGRDGLYFFRDDLGRFVLDGGLNLVGDASNPPNSGGMDGDLDETPTSPNTPSAGGDNSNNAGDDPSPQPERDPQESPAESPSSAPPPLRDRDISALAGLEASARLGGWDWQLQALTDVSGTHEGEQLRFALSRGTRARDNQFGLALGFSWKSAEVMEYYYGVTEGEASEQRPAYRPGNGASPFVRLSWSRPASESWRWLGSVQYEHLSDAVRDSPLVDQNQVMQIFVGGVYHF